MDRNSGSLLGTRLLQSYEGRCLNDCIRAYLQKQQGTTCRSLTKGNPETFGYIILGPLVVGFCHWIATHVNLHDVPQLHFLSRDTRICFDIWQILYGTKWSTQYLLTSRRAVSIASIQTLEDVLRFVSQIKFSQTIVEFFENRFSFQLNSQHARALQKAGLKSAQETIHFQKHNSQLQFFIKEIWDELKISIHDEREAYLQYLSDKNVQDQDAIVDLGYSGTTQKYLSLLTNKALRGLYVGTNAKIAKLDEFNLPSHSFVINRAHRHTNHPFIRNIPLIEYIFLDQEKSLMHFKKMDEKILPVVFLPQENEYLHRINLTQRIHAGALHFAQDWHHHFNGVSLQDPVIAFEMFKRVLDHPHKEDAQIFSGHSFEYNYGKNNKTVWLLVDKEKFVKGNFQHAIKNSQWKPAAYALANRLFCSKYWLSRLKRVIKQTLFAWGQS